MKKVSIFIVISIMLALLCGCSSAPKTISKACEMADAKVEHWNEVSLNSYIYEGVYVVEDNRYILALRMDPESPWFQDPSGLTSAYILADENVIDFYNELAPFFKSVEDTLTPVEVAVMMLDLEDNCFATHVGKPAEEKE